MKTRHLLAALILSSVASNAQISIAPNPFTINTGNITVTYGSSGDYSLFDPLSDPNLFLYSGLETDGDAATWDYHDDWSNVATLTPLTWDATANAYVATLNISTRNYIQEATATSMQIPNGTNVNNYYFLIRNAAGDRQSADLRGTDYGMTPAVYLSNKNFNGEKLIFQIVDGQITTNVIGNSKIDIFSMNGQKIKTVNLNSQQGEIQQKIDLPTGIYVATIQNGGLTKTIKFINK